MKFVNCLLSIFFISIGFGQLDIVLQTGNNGTIKQLDFNASNKNLLSTDSNRIVIWDLSQRKQFTSFESVNKIKNSGFINDTLVYFATSRKIKIWDFYSNTIVDSIISESVISNVKFKNNNLYYLNNRLNKYELNTKSNQKIELTQRNITGFELSNEGQKIGFYSNEYFYLFDLTNQSIIDSVKTKDLVASYIDDQTNQLSIALSPASIHNYLLKDGKLYKKSVIVNDRKWNNYKAIYLQKNIGISGDKKDVITIFDLNKNKITYNFKNKSGSISAISANRSLNIYAVGGENGVIQLYNNTFQKIHTFKSISPIVTCLSVTDDSNFVYLGYNNGELKKWNLLNNNITQINIDKPKFNLIHKKQQIISINSQGGVIQQTHTTNDGFVKKSYFKFIFNYENNTYSVSKVKKSELNNYNISNVKKTKPTIQPQLSENEKIICISDFTINGYHLVSSSSGFLSLHNNKGQLILKIVSPEKNSFFYSTPENYYFASKNALKHVSARYKSQLIGFEQIDLIYNRPDKVLPIINPSLSNQYVQLLSNAYLKRLKKLNIEEISVNAMLKLPIVKSNLQTLNPNTKDSVINININAHSETSQLKSLHILINDVPVFGKSGKAVSNYEFNDIIPITMSSGQNKIQIYVENLSGVKSLRQTALINCEKKSNQNSLYVLSIGSGKFIDKTFDLNYAAKDAKDIANLFSKNKKFKSKHIISITNSEVTNQNVFNSINKLRNVNIDDQIIVFFAGHGVLDENLDYYLSSYDMNFENPSENGINFEAFENALSNLKCRHKLLLIDACHSGELDKEEIQSSSATNEDNEDILVFRSGQNKVEFIDGKSAFELSKTLFADLRSNSGVITISSAGAAEYALEGDNWKNGAFTYCILKGIHSKKADLNQDNKISINELQEFLYIEVPKATNGMQTPTSRVELLEQNFVIW